MKGKKNIIGDGSNRKIMLMGVQFRVVRKKICKDREVRRDEEESMWKRMLKERKMIGKRKGR